MSFELRLDETEGLVLAAHNPILHAGGRRRPCENRFFIPGSSVSATLRALPLASPPDAARIAYAPACIRARLIKAAFPTPRPYGTTASNPPTTTFGAGFSTLDFQRVFRLAPDGDRRRLADVGSKRVSPRPMSSPLPRHITTPHPESPHSLSLANPLSATASTDSTRQVRSQDLVQDAVSGSSCITRSDGGRARAGNGATRSEPISFTTHSTYRDDTCRRPGRNALNTASASPSRPSAIPTASWPACRRLMPQPAPEAAGADPIRYDLHAARVDKRDGYIDASPSAFFCESLDRIAALT